MPPYEERCPKCGTVIALDITAMQKRIDEAGGRKQMRRADQNQEMFEIECVVRSKTVKAIQIETEDGELLWIPKSQIEDWDEEGDIKKIESVSIPLWLAQEKELL